MKIRRGGIVGTVLACAMALVCASCMTQGGKPAKPAAAQPEKGAAFGFITLNINRFSLELAKDGKPVTIEGRANEPVKIEVGDYTLQSCVLQRIDAIGLKWTVMGVKHGEDKFTIKQGETIKLPLGPPFKVAVTGVRQGDDIVFNVASITGQGGETYQPTTIRCGEDNGPMPGVEIRDEAGKFIAEGRFRYGGGGACAYSWRVPPTVKGKIVATPVLNAGPFEIEKVPLSIDL